ncbi:MAG: sugar-binding protein [Methanolobus sp.]
MAPDSGQKTVGLFDEELSRLIDSGVSTSEYSNEPEISEESVYIGVFGNTVEASQSVLGKLISFAGQSNFLIDLLGTSEVSSEEESDLTPEYVESIQCDDLEIVYGTVTIDGSLDDWDDTSGVTLYGLSESESENDRTAVVKAKYDEEYLYLVYDVKDTDLQANKVNGEGGLHLDDSIELYIDTLNDRGTAMLRDDYHLIVNINEAIIDDIGTGTGKDYDYVINMVKNVNLEGTANNAADTDTGFIIELAVPWDDIGGQPSNDVVGILVAVNDLDIEGDVNLLNYCNLIKGTYAVPDNWGSAKIVDK